MTDVSGVFVSLERLRQLEIFEATQNKSIEEICKEYDKRKFEELHKRDKENPEIKKARVAKYYNNNKEEINARRREKRKLAREAKEAAASVPAEGDARA